MCSYALQTYEISLHGYHGSNACTVSAARNCEYKMLPIHGLLKSTAEVNPLFIIRADTQTCQWLDAKYIAMREQGNILKLHLNVNDITE